MPGNPAATLYIGNLDERVNEKSLYEIMIQAGPLVDVYMPRDKETTRHKGFGFAEFKTEESAQYGLRLFSDLLCLYNRPVRLAISGQDKPIASDESKPMSLRRFSETANTSPSNFASASGSHSPFAKSSLGNNYSSPGLAAQSPLRSPSFHAHNYNSGLVSSMEGGWNLKPHMARQAYPHALGRR